MTGGMALSHIYIYYNNNNIYYLYSAPTASEKDIYINKVSI